MPQLITFSVNCYKTFEISVPKLDVCALSLGYAQTPTIAKMEIIVLELYQKIN